MNRTRILIASATVAGGALLLVPGVADAHHPLIAPSADCADDGWTATFTVTPDAVRGLTWSVNSEPFQDDDEAFVFTFDLPLSTLSQSFTANAEWSNDVVNQATASVTRPDGCTIPTTTTTEASTTSPTTLPATTSSTVTTSTTTVPATSSTSEPTTTLPETTTTEPATTTTPPSTEPSTTSTEPAPSTAPSTSSPPSVPSTTQPPPSSEPTTVPPTTSSPPCVPTSQPAPSGTPTVTSPPLNCGTPPVPTLPATGSPSGWLVGVAVWLTGLGAVLRFFAGAGRHRDDVLR